MRSLVLFLSMAAQDAGPVDDCAPACNADNTAVVFCDEDEVVTLLCADVEGSDGCANVSAEWGDDCVLTAGTECDPGYAFGASRCGDGLVCTDGSCVAGDPAGEQPL